MIMEFRTYTMRPGTREQFVRFFETEAVPRMRAAGMTVLGPFSSVTDESVFAYARTFASVEEREEQYRTFYESEDWLGWMIDAATGQEESFVVFLGETGVEPPTRDGMSGTPEARFTLASARGRLSEVKPGLLVVVNDDDDALEFTMHPEVRVYATPNGRGASRALAIGGDDLRAGDHVLVLGTQTANGAVARQVVRRPA